MPINHVFISLTKIIPDLLTVGLMFFFFFFISRET